MKLGETLRAARQRKKYTLRALEKISGVSNALISQIETGHVKDPGFKTVCKIAAALRINIKALAGMENV